MATNEQIIAWLTANPTATDAQITDIANLTGVTPQQLAAVTGLPVSDVVSRMTATGSYEAPRPPVSNEGLAESATQPGGLLDFYKSNLSPDQFAQLTAPLQFSANDSFGGKVQDYQVQLITSLDTSRIAAPKQLEFDSSGQVKTQGVVTVGGGGDAEGGVTPVSGYQSAPELINGIPVTTNYDLNGKVTGYTGDPSVTTWTGGEDRLVGNWNVSGDAAPIGLKSGGSEFSNFTDSIGDLLSSDAAKLAALAAGAMYFGPGLLGADAAATGGLTALDALGADMVTGSLGGAAAGGLGAGSLSAFDAMGADMVTGSLGGAGVAALSPVVAANAGSSLVTPVVAGSTGAGALGGITAAQVIKALPLVPVVNQLIGDPLNLNPKPQTPTTGATGFDQVPIPTDWRSPTYQTGQTPIDLNSIFSNQNMLGGTQWQGLPNQRNLTFNDIFAAGQQQTPMGNPVNINQIVSSILGQNTASQKPA